MPLRFQWHPFTYSIFEDRNVLLNCGGYKILNAVRSTKKKKKNEYLCYLPILEIALLGNIFLLHQNFYSTIDTMGISIIRYNSLIRQNVREDIFNGWLNKYTLWFNSSLFLFVYTNWINTPIPTPLNFNIYLWFVLFNGMKQITNGPTTTFTLVLLP